MSGRGHPLPDSGEARHIEIPEALEDAKGRGEDKAAMTTPNPAAVDPDGDPYRYDDIGRGENVGAQYSGDER